MQLSNSCKNKCITQFLTAKNEIVPENKMIHLRMSATRGWVSVTDALDYL